VNAKLLALEETPAVGKADANAKPAG